MVNLLYKTVSKKIELPYSLTLEKTYEGVRAAKQRALKEKTEKIIYEDGEIRHVENFSISMENKADKEHIPDLLYTKWFDCDKINKLTLRNRQPGDYLVVDDQGSRKKLKDYFIDMKIPRENRDEVLLLADGSHIVWVVGYRISQFYKISGNTKDIIKITYDKE